MDLVQKGEFWGKKLILIAQVIIIVINDALNVVVPILFFSCNRISILFW